MPTRLYDANEQETSEGNLLSSEVLKALRPILMSYSHAGFSRRDIQNILLGAAHEAGLDMMLDSVITEKQYPPGYVVVHYSNPKYLATLPLQTFAIPPEAMARLLEISQSKPTNKVSCIKYLRHVTNAQLREAKDIIDLFALTGRIEPAAAGGVREVDGAIIRVVDSK